jgi:hypothetical protein
MLHDFFSVDKSPLVNFAKGGFKKATLLTALTVTSTTLTTGIISLNVAGIENVGVAEAQFNTYSCNQRTGRGCYILVGAIYTWNPWAASGMCRQKYGYDSFALKYTNWQSPVYHCVKDDPRNLA